MISPQVVDKVPVFLRTGELFGLLNDPMALQPMIYCFMPRRQIRSHLNGIDLTKPVEVVRIPPDGLGPNGNELYQFTKVNSEGKKLGGQYYTDNPNNTPSELGVSDKYTVRDADWNPTDQVNTVKQEKIIFDQSKQVKALKSTSAPINDTWSIEGQSVLTTGTGSQIYVPKNQ